MKKGDRNTKFFHTCAKVKIAKASISHLVNGDNVFTEAMDIEACILNYYKALYSSSSSFSVAIPNQLLEYIPQLVTSEHNILLTQVPTLLEVRKAVFDLNPFSAGGLDKFNGFFYH